MNLSLTNENEMLLSFLVKTPQEKEKFEQEFWQGESRQFFAVSAYRLYKVRERNMGFKEFDDLFTKNSKHALEDLFQQPVDNQTANAIINKVSIGVLTTKSIYDRFVEENGQLNITRLAYGTRKRR